MLVMIRVLGKNEIFAKESFDIEYLERVWINFKVNQYKKECIFLLLVMVKVVGKKSFY